jgi:hypothetical protein
VKTSTSNQNAAGYAFSWNTIFDPQTLNSTAPDANISDMSPDPSSSNVSELADEFNASMSLYNSMLPRM